MKIVIPDIPKEGIDVDVQETLSSDDSLFTISGQLRIEKVGVEIWIRGNLKADVSLQCSRCLKSITGEITIPVDVIYHPLEELAGEDHHEIQSEELDLDFYAGDELDISRLLREQVALNVPMKPLCHEACKGLCPGCGTDLNLGTCACSRNNIDERFGELKKLIQERKEI